MGVVLMSIVVGVVVLLLSYILIRFVKFIKWNRKMKKILSHFPGPKPHWFFGNALQEFKPERFEGDKHHEMDPYSFIPFSAGPRNCIGQAFAQNEEKVLIARLINRFEISIDPDHEVEPFIEVVMRAKNGIMVNFKERNP